MAFLSCLYPLVMVAMLGTVFVLALARRTQPRTLMILLTMTALVYVLVIVVPFFAYGLHLQDAEAVRRGAFDPKGYPLFDGTFADGWLHLFALLFLSAAPVVTLITSARLINEMRTGWNRMRAGMRTISVALVIVGFVIVGFMFTPLGHTITVWHFD